MNTIVKNRSAIAALALRHLAHFIRNVDSSNESRVLWLVQDDARRALISLADALSTGSSDHRTALIQFAGIGTASTTPEIVEKWAAAWGPADDGLPPDPSDFWERFCQEMARLKARRATWATLDGGERAGMIEVIRCKEASQPDSTTRHGWAAIANALETLNGLGQLVSDVRSAGLDTDAVAYDRAVLALLAALRPIVPGTEKA